MKKAILVSIVILFISFVLPSFCTLAFGISSRWGIGTGLIFSESQAFTLQGIGELSMRLIHLRTSLEYSNLFGVSIFPIDGTLILELGRGLKPYVGVGGGILYITSNFGSFSEYTFNALGGVELRWGGSSLFTQLKVRASGKRGFTYQLDIGALF